MRMQPAPVWLARDFTSGRAGNAAGRQFGIKGLFCQNVVTVEQMMNVVFEICKFREVLIGIPLVSYLQVHA